MSMVSILGRVRLLYLFICVSERFLSSEVALGGRYPAGKNFFFLIP